MNTKFEAYRLIKVNSMYRLENFETEELWEEEKKENQQENIQYEESNQKKSVVKKQSSIKTPNQKASKKCEKKQNTNAKNKTKKQYKNELKNFFATSNILIREDKSNDSVFMNGFKLNNIVKVYNFLFNNGKNLGSLELLTLKKLITQVPKEKVKSLCKNAKKMLLV